MLLLLVVVYLMFAVASVGVFVCGVAVALIVCLIAAGVDIDHNGEFYYFYCRPALGDTYLIMKKVLVEIWVLRVF